MRYIVKPESKIIVSYCYCSDCSNCTPLCNECKVNTPCSSKCPAFCGAIIF
ncbi:MAG: Clo7bot family Cys-rich peptide [Thermoanaerobacteraceae bacterium]